MRRTFPWGLVGLLAAYVLLAPPVFFFAPLALLLLLTVPRSGREWLWLAVSAVLALLWTISGVTALAPGVTAAAGVIGAGIFLALGLGTSWRLFSRAMTAAGLGLASVAIWAFALGQSWADVQASFAQGLRQIFSQQADALAVRGFDAAAVAQLRDMGDSTAQLAPYFAAFLVLAALAGFTLAARWHEWLGSRSLGAASGPFRRFRFSDQAIWLLVLGLALWLVPLESGYLLGAPTRTWAANLAVVMAACYALRGLAVYRSAAVHVPRGVNVVLALVSALFLPIASTGLALLGLSDSWIDFRRRFGVPQPEDGTDDRSDSAR
ncbi:MAG TPA: DUF2232 domain-containing protein [Gemmatimonadales bacterium]|nr:DUF2232 domain-containing protein [Gemmatimonadales bacterium]